MYRNVEMPHSMFEAFPPAAGPVVGEPRDGDVQQHHGHQGLVQLGANA